MFIPKKTIPKLAFTGLALTATAVGCGGDDSNPKLSGSTDIEKVNSIGDALCEKDAQCDPDGFAADYASLDECVAGNEAYTQAEFDEFVSYYGQDCVDALISYYNCVLN
ncbi:MAG: hypothetical protein R3A47_06200 [Polyangiales bacterium]